MAEKVKWMTMKHKDTGEVITGVHPTSVPAHEAIGYVVIVDAKEPAKDDVKKDGG